MEGVVNVRTFLSKDEAEIVKGFLSENGIEATISSDDLGGYRPHLTFGMRGVELLVNKKDLQKAQELLDSIDSDEENEELKKEE